MAPQHLVEVGDLVFNRLMPNLSYEFLKVGKIAAKSRLLCLPSYYKLNFLESDKPP
jgi:hypothetical protein